MDMRRLVGRNIRRLRLAKGVTQEQLAERSGFTQFYVSSLELGRRNPTIVSIYELAQALGVPHVELVAPDGEEPADPPSTRSKRQRREPRKA